MNNSTDTTSESCINSQQSLVITSLYGIIAAFNFLLSAYFLLGQWRRKGSAALTKFTLLAALIPIGTCLSSSTLAITKPMEYCGLVANQIASAIESFGSWLTNLAYLVFLYYRSQALLSPQRRRILSWAIFISCATLFADSAASQIIYAENPNPDSGYTTFLAVFGALTGLFIFCTDITFLITFIRHLRYMNVRMNNWFFLEDDDDALKIIAKHGIRGCSTVLTVVLLNIIALIVNGYENLKFEYQIVFILLFVVLSSLGYTMISMKWEVDKIASSQASSRETSTAGSFQAQKKTNKRVLESLNALPIP